MPRSEPTALAEQTALAAEVTAADDNLLSSNPSLGLLVAAPEMDASSLHRGAGSVGGLHPPTMSHDAILASWPNLRRREIKHCRSVTASSEGPWWGLSTLALQLQGRSAKKYPLTQLPTNCITCVA